MNLELIDLEIENKLKPERGRILISEPFLDDDYFGRSVVLLCEHNEEGSFGFVLNKYIPLDLDKIVPDIEKAKMRMSVGGPVKKSNLYYIHTLGEKLPGSNKVTDGVYMGGDFDLLVDMINKQEIRKEEVRFFVGYSGWSPNQLEEELAAKSWLVARASAREIMNTSIDNLWSEVLRKQGPKYKMMAQFPKEPKWN